MSDESTNNAITIGGRQFVASCLTLGVMRRNVGALKTVMAMRADGGERTLPSTEEFDAIIAIVGASVKPVEPLPGSMNFAQFIDEMDFKKGIGDLLGGLKKVMELSGYQQPAGGTTDAGESKSAAPST